MMGSQEYGVTRYEPRPEQGPGARCWTVGANIYRNYFAPVAGSRADQWHASLLRFAALGGADASEAASRSSSLGKLRTGLCAVRARRMDAIADIWAEPLKAPDLEPLERGS